MIEQMVEDICDDEEREIINFGIERLKVASISLVIVIVTSIVLHEVIRSVLLLICLLPLRQNAGGYHMKSSRVCAVSSYVVIVLSILCIRFWRLTPFISLLLMIICSFVIILISPVGTENHMLDVYEKKIYGKRARVICFIESVLFLILLFFEKSDWYIVILMAEIITSFLLLIGKIKEPEISES